MKSILIQSDFETIKHNGSIPEYVPSKIWVCHCKQCRYAKNSRRNRKNKNKIKRWLNKKRRKNTGSGIVFYWI